MLMRAPTKGKSEFVAPTIGVLAADSVISINQPESKASIVVVPDSPKGSQKSPKGGKEMMESFGLRSSEAA